VDERVKYKVQGSGKNFTTMAKGKEAGQKAKEVWEKGI